MGNLKELNSKKSKQEETLLTDQDLWQKIRTGDRKAFASLFKNYYQQLYRFTGRIVRDTHAAENIVQDLFVTIWTKRESLFIKSSLKSYLYTAVKNRGFSYRSRQVPDELTTDQATASPEEDYLKKELHTAVHRAIGRLPEKCRLVYEMKRYDNLPHAEIAELLNISVNTVKTQLQRALKSLEKQLIPFIK